MSDDNFGVEKKREAEFITPPNTIKEKVGSGGLSAAILSEAEKIVENNNVDFTPQANRYLSSLEEGLRLCEAPNVSIDSESLISTLLYPAMQLKANGTMFGFSSVSIIGARLIQFLEVIASPPDQEALEVIHAFAAAIKGLIASNVKDADSAHTQNLYQALNDACFRYLNRVKNEA